MLNLIAKKILRTALSLFGRAENLSLPAMQEAWLEARVCGVVCAAGLGDALMATPLLEEIKRRRPDLRVIVIAKKSTAAIFARNPHVDHVISYHLGQNAWLSFARALKQLRNERPDVLIATQPANRIRHSLIAICSGAKVRLKHAYDHGEHTERNFAFAYSAQLPDRMDRHRVELNLDLLRLLGEKIVERRSGLRFYIDAPAHERAQQRLIASGVNMSANALIAFHPGGGRQNKWWLPERFVQVGRDLLRRGYQVCLVGGPEEKTLCEDIAKRMNLPPAWNFSGKLTLEETAALLKCCNCLLSNDSGIMHLATAVDTPVVALFGPTDFRHIGPFSPHARVLCKSGDMQDLTCTEVLYVVSKQIQLGEARHAQRCDRATPAGALSPAAV